MGPLVFPFLEQQIAGNVQSDAPSQLLDPQVERPSPRVGAKER